MRTGASLPLRGGKRQHGARDAALNPARFMAAFTPMGIRSGDSLVDASDARLEPERRAPHRAPGQAEQLHDDARERIGSETVPPTGRLMAGNRSWPSRPARERNPPIGETARCRRGLSFMRRSGWPESRPASRRYRDSAEARRIVDEHGWARCPPASRSSGTGLVGHLLRITGREHQSESAPHRRPAEKPLVSVGVVSGAGRTPAPRPCAADGRKHADLSSSVSAVLPIGPEARYRARRLRVAAEVDTRAS